VDGSGVVYGSFSEQVEKVSQAWQDEFKQAQKEVINREKISFALRAHCPAVSLYATDFCE